ncbi:hypothetical protein BALOs_2665 [Halobacteriovorax sp. BALOs_7]|uniref:hypothetical protein n=1 Tax=Halobacteriovorax sp. BALOs_7 TaxID=2109558 RepID=UPI000EA3EE41|nr:hypothetical protein [Halobacteriovorax sp. BALOs_7]AYF45657.1 hypothetical protein BALOs_2665 [Halobacteriovorax sp. BALOs_7]
MREIKQTSIHIKDSPLLRGELFWCRPSGRRLCIGHAGEFANLELIEKLSSTNDQFIQEVLIDEERVSQVIDHFNELKSTNLEDVKMRYRNLVLVDFYRVLKGEQKSSTLDFLFICYEVFNDLVIDEKDIEDEFIRTNAMTLKKAQVSASIVIYMALVSGYCDFNFLKEVYNTIILTYYSYVSRYDHIVDEYSRSDKNIVHQEYLKGLSSRFFELDYGLSDDISSIWSQVHHKVFKLDLEFNASDLESIFKSILKTVKEYRYIDEIMTQESSR